MSVHLSVAIEPYGPAAAIPLTEAQAAELSSAKQPPVVVTIGDRSARLRVTRMGGPVCIGLSKAARRELGVEIGDLVDVTIALDEAERVVAVPEALQRALTEDARLQSAWDDLSYTRRKELARGITDAKREITRQRRLEAALAELADR
ncbi:MAG: YdeI/OmpD-associated family protein [Mobilicoccus sp.]|nr:YdeI/OmpD-associated family protein [Mobilicoccus sp.]